MLIGKDASMAVWDYCNEGNEGFRLNLNKNGRCLYFYPYNNFSRWTG